MMRRFVVVLVFLLITGNVSTNANSAPAGCPSPVGYYILIAARLQTSDRVWVHGYSNLPSGAILHLRVDDYIGEGASVVGRDISVTLRSKGIIDAEIGALPQKSFKANMVCSAVFAPSRQPKNVLAIVGSHGQNLGDTAMNPQIETVSGGALLAARTVVTP